MTSTFVHSAGSSGYLITPFAVYSTSELGSLTNGSYVLSSSSFKQTNTGGGQRGLVWFQTTSTAGVQQTAGGNLSGWWVHSDASGVFEVTSTVAGMGRPPDFIIPFPATTTTIATTGNYFATGYPILPWDNFKVFTQNNAGVTLGSTSGQIFVGPVADDVV